MNNEIKSIAIRSISETGTKLAEWGYGDSKVIVWDLGFCRVAETNGDPVWEESDPQGFADLVAGRI
jgi:hypothetical protein